MVTWLTCKKTKTFISLSFFVQPFQMINVIGLKGLVVLFEHVRYNHFDRNMLLWSLWLLAFNNNFCIKIQFCNLLLWLSMSPEFDRKCVVVCITTFSCSLSPLKYQLIWSFFVFELIGKPPKNEMPCFLLQIMSFLRILQATLIWSGE